MGPLYTVEHPAEDPVTPRVLLHHFDGAMDAGHAGALAIEQLLMTLPHERLATFDVDTLIDYRARRPVVTYATHTYESVIMPELVLDLLQDDEGEDLLVLHGAEPDFRWNEFVGAVTHLAVSMGVSRAVGMTGLPLATPHTRPTYVHHHGNRPELLPEQPDFFGRVEVPGSMSAFLELRLGQAGLDSRGLSAGDLEAAANINRAEIDAEAAGQPEVAAVVSALEAQYDAVAPVSSADLARIVDVPSADEIGARLEAFLQAAEADPDAWHLDDRRED